MPTRAINVVLALVNSVKSRQRLSVLIDRNRTNRLQDNSFLQKERVVTALIALLPYTVGILVVVDTISAVLCENCCIYDSIKSLAILELSLIHI